MADYDEKEASAQLKQYIAENDQSTTKWSPVFKRINRARNYAKGYRRGISHGKMVHDDEGSHQAYVQANLIFSNINSLVPHIYAKNPEMAIRPAAHVTPRHPDYTLLRRFARTCELVVNDTFREAKLKKRMKHMLRSAMTAKVGWAKISYQRDYYRDPVIENRINDIQDQLASIGNVMEQLAADGIEITAEIRELKEAELQDKINSLRAQVEVMRAEGLCIDVLRVDDVRMDPAIDILDDYLNARWISHRSFYPPNTAASMYELDDAHMKCAKRYGKNADGSPIREGEAASGEADNGTSRLTEQGPQSDRNTLVAVWERWDRDTNTVYTWLEGAKEWAREPWSPARGGERFFPFFLLGFNWLDGEEWPLSDVELLMELQDEYQLTREQQAKHRALSKPFWLYDKGNTDKPDVTSFEVAEIAEIVGLDAQGQPVNNVFVPATAPPYNPAIYDSTPIRSDMDMMSGLPEAYRAGMVKNKTATEATMQDQGMTGRTGEKQDIIEELLTEMAEYSLQLLLQNVQPEEIKRRYGADAVWPMLETKWSLYNGIHVEIRAGSTGKPNKMLRLQQWTMLLPEIRSTLDRALMMQAQMGMPIEDNPYVNTLRETLERMDERFDIMEFLGGTFGQMQALAQQAIQQPGGPAIAELMNNVTGAGGSRSVGSEGRPKQPGSAGERQESDAVSYTAQGSPQMGPQPPEPLQ